MSKTLTSAAEGGRNTQGNPEHDAPLPFSISTVATGRPCQRQWGCFGGALLAESCGTLSSALSWPSVGTAGARSRWRRGAGHPFAAMERTHLRICVTNMPHNASYLHLCPWTAVPRFGPPRQILLFFTICEERCVDALEGLVRDRGTPSDSGLVVFSRHAALPLILAEIVTVEPRTACVDTSELTFETRKPKTKEYTTISN